MYDSNLRLLIETLRKFDFFLLPANRLSGPEGM